MFTFGFRLSLLSFALLGHLERHQRRCEDLGRQVRQQPLQKEDVSYRESVCLCPLPGTHPSLPGMLRKYCAANCKDRAN